MILETCTEDGIYTARQVALVKFSPGEVSYIRSYGNHATGSLVQKDYGVIRVLSDSGVLLAQPGKKS